MRKISLLAIVLSSVIFSSCAKDWTCECQYLRVTPDGVYYVETKKEATYKKNLKDARKDCDQHATPTVTCNIR